MARVTVEDCIVEIPNRFELVVTASQRAKAIASGVPLTLDRDNDKDSVVSLREIAEKTIDIEGISEELIQSFQKPVRSVAETAEEEDAKPSLPPALEAMQAEMDSASDFGMQPDENYAGSLSFIEDNVEVED